MAAFLVVTGTMVAILMCLPLWRKKSIKPIKLIKPSLWEQLGDGLERRKIEGGWLYRQETIRFSRFVSDVFVPENK